MMSPQVLPALSGVGVALAVMLGAGLAPPDSWVPVGASALGAGLLAAFAMRCHLKAEVTRRQLEAAELAARIDGLHAAGAIGRVGDDEQTPERACPLRQIEHASHHLALLRQVAEGVYGVEALFDRRCRLNWISPSIERLTGYSPADCLAAEEAIAFLVHESDRRYCMRVADQVLSGGGQHDFEMRLTRRDGTFGWVACHWRPVIGEDGEIEGLRMSAEDIQGRKEAEYKLLETVAELRRAQALREHYLSRSNDERQRLAALLNVIRLGILFIDHDHRVLYFNRAMLEIWGFPPDENLIGMRDVVLQSKVGALLEEPESFFAHVQAIVGARVAVSDRHEQRFRDGRIVTDISAVVEGGQGRRGIGRVWIYEDVTEQRRIAAQLVSLAERDPLTNLYNRRRFHEELERLLAEAERHGVQVGLVAIDLDGFKPINDRFGHQAGDEVLIGLAEGVGRIVRRNEMFFRLGGDEFGVLVPDTNERELSELAGRLVDGVDALRFEFCGETVGVTASIGIALYPAHGRDGEALMAAADEAMYRSKSGGRNQWSVALPKSGLAAPLHTGSR